MNPLSDPAAADRVAGDGRPPRALDVVLGGVALEAVVLGAGVVWALADLVAGRSTAPGASVALAVILAVAAASVVAAARALRRGARRARGLVVTWQLLQATSGVALLGTPEPPAALLWVAGGAVALALVVLAAALSPAATRFVVAHDVPQDEAA